MDSEVSTSSRLPARISMKISWGGWAQWGPMGQDPEQTPHCMHMRTHSPSSTFASTSLRKLVRYFSTIAVFRFVIFGSPEGLLCLPRRDLDLGFTTQAQT